jgi:hypothetical protein
MSNAKFAAAIAAINEQRDKSGIPIDGKLYSRVKDRIEVFRREWGDEYGIDTNIEIPDGMGDGGVIIAIAKITKDTTVLASGHAMVVIGSDEFTTTSPIEVAETSAIGRALACFGLHGGEYASSQEIEAKRQNTPMSQRAYRDNDSPASRGPQGPYNDMDPNAWRAEAQQGRQEPRQQERLDPPPQQRGRYTEPPPAHPSGLYVPDLQDEWQPEADQQRILAVIDSIDSVPLLGRYWNELKPFMQALGSDSQDLTAEIKAAFATANNVLGGK